MTNPAHDELHEILGKQAAQIGNKDEKARLVELMWQVSFTDDHMDKYEEHLIRRVADLLYVPHRQFITAKLRAQKSNQ